MIEMITDQTMTKRKDKRKNRTINKEKTEIENTKANLMVIRIIEIDIKSLILNLMRLLRVREFSI